MSTTIRILVGLSLAATMAGCHAFDREYLSLKVASQVTVTKAEPPPGCELVGAIKGATAFGELSDAHTELLRAAVLRGGNYVSVDLVERPMIAGVGGYTVRGRLFACKAPMGVMAATPMQPAVVAQPHAAEVKACEPDCAAGFTCQLGACVAAAPAQAGR